MQIINRKTYDSINAELSIKTKGDITAQVLGSDSIPKKRVHIPMNSLNQNYLRLIRDYSRGINTPTLIRTDGSENSQGGGTTSTRDFRLDLNKRTLPESGIRLGLSDTEMQIDDFNLADIIPHGNGSGELFGEIQYPFAKTNQMVIPRTFENNSGFPIEVKELGIIGRRQGDSILFLIARDVLPEPITIQNGERLSVNVTAGIVEGNVNFNDIWRWFVGAVRTDNYMNGVDINGVARYNDNTPIFMYNTLSSAGASHGIFLGSSDQPVDFFDHKMPERIEEGTGSNQLSYGQSSITDFLMNVDQGVCSFEVSRPVTNNSGSDILVVDMGLVGGGFQYLLDRYILPTPITIKNGTTRTARWRFQYSI